MFFPGQQINPRFMLGGESDEFPTPWLSQILWIILICFPTLEISANPVLTTAVDSTQDSIAFNQQIRPILSENCFACHGPDASKRKAKLRLDFQPEDESIWSPNHPAQSEALRRITTADPEDRMPPPDSGSELDSFEIQLIRKWIESGAPYERHWSFQPIRRPALPEVQKGDWIRNPIDNFILARLEKQNLSPAPEADPDTLQRRLALDLTGLPNLPDATSTPYSEDAYGEWVESALNSPAFGEHLAGPWLDAARYADSNGYQNDGDREMWRWRDWVIEAFNNNMPFDEFTIQQIAGDLLPNPTLSTRIATAFHRLHRYNSEGGSIPEETLVENAVDRVSTTGTVWLGLTLGCARCHDHKYDPVSQKEFYQLFAYFNNITETGRAMLDGNSQPFIPAPTREQLDQEKILQSEIAKSYQRLSENKPLLVSELSKWNPCLDDEITFLEKNRVAWIPLNGDLNGIYPAPKDPDKESGPKLEWKGSQPDSFPNWIVHAPGQSYGLHFKKGDQVNAGSIGGFGNRNPYTITVRARPDEENSGALLSRMHVDATGGLGYSLAFREGRFEFWYVSQGHAGQMRFRTEQRFSPKEWYHVAVTYDGRHTSSAYQILIDGQPQDLEVLLNTDSNPGGASSAPFCLGSSPRHEDYSGALADVRLFSECLSKDEIQYLAEPASIQLIQSQTINERTKIQSDKFQRAFLDQTNHPVLSTLWTEYQKSVQNLERHQASYPTLMVMEESATTRPAFLLDRGEYDRPKDPVQRATLDSLHAFQSDWPQNRLGLAKWLVDKENPLTARVIVNQFWQNIFGRGLVATPEDFGSQGSPPSHPELLDWLAAEFMYSGWDVKALHRLIVSSATYRQSSNWTSEKLEKDPENISLSRYPRRRLSARQIRDQALEWARLLQPAVGGPPAYPEQPAGIWSEVSRKKYRASKDQDRYRRSLYTVWKRTLPPPNMMNFDAADRESCRVQTHRTNTPLQALTLLNDPTFTFAAREMGRHVLESGGSDWASRVHWAYQTFLNRTPSAEEMDSWIPRLKKITARYAANPEEASAWLDPGNDPDPNTESPINPAEWATAKTFSLILLNLDESITQE